MQLQMCQYKPPCLWILDTEMKLIFREFILMHWQLLKLFPCSTMTARLMWSVKGMVQHSAKVPMDFLPLGQLPCSVAFITALCNILFIVTMNVWKSELPPWTLDKIYRIKNPLSISTEFKLSEVEADRDHPLRLWVFLLVKINLNELPF